MSSFIPEPLVHISSLLERTPLITQLSLVGMRFKTHLGWPGDIDLGSGSMLLLEISCSILSGANLGGLI